MIFPILFASFLSLLAASCAGSQPHFVLCPTKESSSKRDHYVDEKDFYPEKKWPCVSSLQQAGWRKEGLQKVKEWVEEKNSDAFLIITGGKLVMQIGDVDKPIEIHSMRKSVLSMLYGIYIAIGAIDPQKTLAQLAIDDSPEPLAVQEKEATILDLLKSRSGVYHLAAAEAMEMKWKRPERKTYPPGTHWYYNNWDMNALGTIFNRETGASLFEAFEKNLAQPLQMQHFNRKKHTRYDKDSYSQHPAYKMELSASDLARLGLLYLRGGRWRERQIVPKTWTEESTRSYSRTGDVGSKSGYGYTWWVTVDNPENKEDQPQNGIYSASGYGGQRLIVMPAIDTVVVHLFDYSIWTYLSGNWIGTPHINELVTLIQRARE